MKAKLFLATFAVLLLAGTVAALRSEPIGELDAPAQVVFVCKNGVAMSLWSAAYFNRLASERGLPERATARASIPSYSDVPLRMRVGLAVDGFRLGGFLPRVIDDRDARSGALVVAISDADLSPAAAASFAHAESWQGFPPMREQYFPSRAALKQKVEDLVARIAAQRVDLGTPAAFSGPSAAQ